MNITRRATLAALAGSLATLRSMAAGPEFPGAAETLTSTPGNGLSEAQIVAGRRFLAAHPSVDVHAHPGRFFLRDVVNPTPRLVAYGEPFETQAVAALHAGRVSAALFSAVSDAMLLDVSSTGGLYATRAFEPGEAWAEYQRQLRVSRKLLAADDLVAGRAVSDIVSAHTGGRTACVFSVEGGDFIEADLDRVHQAYADGVRCITLVHYTINQIGDIQTAQPRHGGLTPLGSQIVREMNRAGILVDVAHATYDVTRGAIEVADRPMILSHSNLTVPDAPNARLITAEHARLVASHGGIIGSTPWGISQSSFADWIDSILRLADVVGIHAVAIGTDMDATFRPVFGDYRQWELIPAALLARGLAEGEVAGILGGNFLRVFAQASPAKAPQRPPASGQ